MFFFVSFLFCRLIASPFHLNSVKGNEKEGKRAEKRGQVDAGGAVIET